MRTGPALAVDCTDEEEKPVVHVQLVPAPLDRREAFDALFDAEYDGLVRLAVLLLGDQHIAEEVVQDSFACVWERWDRLERQGGYLRTCVVNACRDQKRRWRRRDLLAPAAEPSSTSDEIDHLLDALSTLAPKRRAALVLRYYLDLPEAEVAELLNVRVGTVKSMVHRALADLREVVER